MLRGRFPGFLTLQGNYLRPTVDKKTIRTWALALPELYVLSRTGIF